MKDIKKMKQGSAPQVVPMGDRVLIKEYTKNKENKTASGIIIPITIHEDKGSKRGEIVAIGQGHFEDGILIPISAKIGDEVLFQWGDKILFQDEEYYIVKESELLALIK